MSDTSVLAAIDAECVKQDAKGFDAAHDDGHTDASILRCAICVAKDVLAPMSALSVAQMRQDFLCDNELDPWPAQRAEHIRTKYADDEEHRLVIAAALIVKEIYRRRRASR